MSQEHEHMTIREWIAVLGGALGAFMAILDIQVTNASIREISGALNLDISESGWISTAYLIAEIIVIPLTAFFSTSFGIRKYLVSNCIGFLFASILCGLSWSPGSMIFFRALQGFTGGTLIPMSFQIILSLMPEKQKPIGLTIFGLTVTLAPTLGPSLGGWLTDEYGWRFIFFINLVPGLLMIAALRFGLEQSKPKLEYLKKLDRLSVLALVVALSSFTYILEEGPKEDWFDSQVIRFMFLASLLSFPFFIMRQFEVPTPILNLRLFQDRNFAIGTVVTALAGCALFSGIYSLSLFLGQVQSYSASQIGHVLMWVGMPQLLVMPFVPVLMKKFDLRLLAIIGMAMFAYSNWMNTDLNMHFGGEEFRLSLLVRAFGQPLFVIPLSVMSMSMIQKDQAGDASSIFNVMRNLGASLGIALTSTFLVKRQTLHMLSKAESLSSFDFSLNEKIYKTEQSLRGAGLDAQSAKMRSLQETFRPTVRDSVIAAFSDIFFVLSFGLIVCIILIMLLRKINAPAGDAEIEVA